MTEPLRPRSQPHIRDRADGCPGHYCIARRCPRGNWMEFWTETRQNKHLWTSAGTVYHNLEQAYQALTKAQRTGNTPTTQDPTP